MPPTPQGSVRCVFVSDTHSHLGKLDLPMGDVLCHTGDISFCSQGGKAMLEAFDQQLAALPHPHKVVIAGNHDRRIEQLGAAQAREILRSAHYLENSGVWLEGLHFWGSPFSARHKRRSSNNAFQYNEERQRLTWKYVPRTVDVLLTHGGAEPERGEGCDGGGQTLALKALLGRVQPWLHAHGHDHALHGASLDWPSRSAAALVAETENGVSRERRVAKSGRAESNRAGCGRLRPALITINAAICNSRYEPVQLPVVVDLPRAQTRTGGTASHERLGPAQRVSESARDREI